MSETVLPYGPPKYEPDHFAPRPKNLEEAEAIVEGIKSGINKLRQSNGEHSPQTEAKIKEQQEQLDWAEENVVDHNPDLKEWGLTRY